MVDLEKLKSVIKDSGMTVVSIAAKSGIERATLYNRLSGTVGEFTVSEIERISNVLQLDTQTREEIFFADEVH